MSKSNKYVFLFDVVRIFLMLLTKLCDGWAIGQPLAELVSLN
jgi:hypothetical protein